MGHGSSARLSRATLLVSISIHAGPPARRSASAGMRECSQRNCAHRGLGPAEARHGLRDHARDHQDARGAVLVAGEPGHVGHAHEVGHAVHALERVLLGRLLLGAAPADVRGPVGEGEGDRALARREAVALGAVGRPARGQVGLVLREDHVRVAQAAVVGHGADAGQGAAQVLLQQAQRAADAGARRPLRIRAEAAEAGVQPDPGADRPVDDHHRKRAARRGLQRLASRLGIEEGLHRRHEHREVLGPPARHRQRDGARLDRGHAAPRGKGAELPPARVRGAGEDPVHALPRRGPERQAVAPAVGEHQVVGAGERVLDARALHADHRRLAPGVAVESRAPARQPVVELLLARLHRGDVAARQEHLDGEGDHRRVRRQAEAGDRVRHDARRNRPGSA